MLYTLFVKIELRVLLAIPLATVSHLPRKGGTPILDKFAKFCFMVTKWIADEFFVTVRKKYFLFVKVENN